MKIEHVAMYVNDLEAAKNFFEKYMGAKSNNLYHNQKTDFKSYFLTFEDGARLEIMNKPGLDDDNVHRGTGFVHIAFSVGSREKVDALTAQMNQDGYKVMSGPKTTGDGYYESLILAIEGNLIEITV